MHLPTYLAIGLLGFFLGFIMTCAVVSNNYGRVNLEKSTLQFQGNSYRIQEIK